MGSKSARRNIHHITYQVPICLLLCGSSTMYHHRFQAYERVFTLLPYMARTLLQLLLSGERFTNMQSEIRDIADSQADKYTDAWVNYK